MSFRLRTIEFTADGRRIVRDRDVDKPAQTIGRAAENDIHLPDLAVDPSHARLEVKGDGRVLAEALGTLGFGFDGVSTMRADIDPAKGGELRFGTYNLTVSRDADGTPLITIAQIESQDAAEAMDEKKSFSLASVMPGKRNLSWYLALLIFAVFVAFPIASNALYDPAGKGTVIGDGSWSAGKLSKAHHALEQKCEACHVKPFEPVQDKACLTCHQTVHDHADSARLAASRAEQPLGKRFLWTVAHTFGKPGPGACTDCHTEHEGAGRMEPAAQQFCSDCHGMMDERLTDTALGNASDFGKLHPQFRPTIPLTLGSGKLTPVSLDKNPREASGLAFPHALHLNRRGGVARMAASIGGERGYGTGGLECKDCHRPTEDGVRFLPIDMERDCESCHSLAYDKVGGTFRKLRHGDVDQMVADLTVAGGGSGPIVSGRKRPGDYAAGKSYYARFNAPAGGAGLAAQALSRDGICGECHTPDYSAGRLGVIPVTQVSRFMPHGWFDHKPHRQEKCTSCHLAETSKSSSDLLLPGIAQCRTCHLGEDAMKAKVPSSCAMCHGYHPSAEAPINSRPNKS
jgi:predicted CXXCH cytochrome family protein